VKKLPEHVKDKQDRIIDVLQEILKWTKVTSIPQVKKLLLDILPSNNEKIAYHLSDGGRGSQEVAKSAKVSYVTVTKWWKIWARAGIAEMLNVKGGERAKRIFSLEDFGIPVPKPEEIKPEKKAEASSTEGKS
jgi:hypothetical protein